MPLLLVPQRLYPALALVSLIILLGMTATPQAADDWVLTDRFKTQLKDAQKGDSLAMYEVGRMYERGRGTEQDVNKAADWYKKASENGQYEAKARLGILYLEGNGVDRNPAKALDLLASSAEAGVATAQFYLATMYENGEGVAADDQKALNLYKAAANGGYYQAKARIAALATKPVPRKPVPRPRAVPKPAPAVTATKSDDAPVVMASAAPPAATTKTEKPGEVLLSTILAGRWVGQNGEPAGFLPSKTTLCDREGELGLKCVSGEQWRNTGALVISYVLEASLSGFNASDQFNVQYVNNVLGTKDAKKKPGDDQAALSFGVKTGKQATVHKLNCELEEENKLVCVKDRITTITFTR
ncbi:MAG: sel1 repeat family protein [Gammaproteobacteria bacterium]|nr:sel1 repeat family protein [Gammaproteobacteria bacterium]